MNEEFFGQEPKEKPKEEESKYPLPFKPEPEIIYGLEMIGGVAPDGSRYKQPRILDKKKVSKEGVPYTSHWVTVKATPIIINDAGNPETPYERKEYTWFVPSQCIAKTQEYFNANMYQICFQKLSRLNPETGSRYNDYIVGKKMEDFIIFPDTNERIHKLFGSEKEEIQKPMSKLEQMDAIEKLDEKEPPFDSDTTDDPVAFKKDITPKEQPKTTPTIVEPPKMRTEVNVNGEYVLAVLKDIENLLTDIFGVSAAILGALKKDKEE